MDSPFLNLPRPTLLSLASALETGKLSSPFSAAMLTHYVPLAQAPDIVAELTKLEKIGATTKLIAYTLRLLALEREASQNQRDRVELVWTGPETPRSESRDTFVVVRQLFAQAKQTILIATFAIDKGEKARELFGELAQRMDREDHLQVQLFLNLMLPYPNRSDDTKILQEFAKTFRQEIWPGSRLPQVFYDRRSLEENGRSRSCLHAKCVIIDNQLAFITSANFTQAAHLRNIEAGVLLDDPLTATALRSQFESLVAENLLCHLIDI